MPGVVRTRVGYTGGQKTNPTYYSLGDHTETLQVDFDSRQISYAQLLDVFWATHNPCASKRSRQYMSAVFYGSEAQKEVAEQTRAREAARRGTPVTTDILPLTTFYLAEDYHQKYMLRSSNLMREFKAMYPDTQDFVNSTAAARVNGYLGDNGNPAQLEKEIGTLGLSPQGQEMLRKSVRGSR